MRPSLAARGASPPIPFVTAKGTSFEDIRIVVIEICGSGRRRRRHAPLMPSYTRNPLKPLPASDRCAPGELPKAAAPVTAPINAPTGRFSGVGFVANDACGDGSE